MKIAECRIEERKFDHVYCWGNNERRKELKGRKCRILTRLKMNSVVVEFENGETEITSRYAIRKCNRR